MAVATAALVPLAIVADAEPRHLASTDKLELLVAAGPIKLTTALVCHTRR